MISLPEPAYDLSPLRPGEIPLWQLVIAQFRLPEPTVHGASHWLTVLRNGMELCRHHPADEEIVRLFALFHDSCRHVPVDPHSMSQPDWLERRERQREKAREVMKKRREDGRSTS